MEKILMTTAIGAGFGLVFGVFGNVIQNKRNMVNDLGRDWPYLKTDEEIKFVMFELKSYKDLNDDCASHYYAIGDNINNIIELFALITKPDAKINQWFAYRSYTYKEAIIKAFSAWSIAVQHHKKLLGHKNMDPANESVQMEEFLQLAEKMAEFVNVYYVNTVFEIQGKAQAMVRETPVQQQLHQQVQQQLHQQVQVAQGQTQPMAREQQSPFPRQQSPFPTTGYVPTSPNSNANNTNKQTYYARQSPQVYSPQTVQATNQQEQEYQLPMVNGFPATTL